MAGHYQGHLYLINEPLISNLQLDLGCLVSGQTRAVSGNLFWIFIPGRGSVRSTCG